MYVEYMTIFKDLFNPQVAPREPNEYKKLDTVDSVAINVGIAAIFGRNASFVDKAAYVAYPFAVEYAAKRGAQRG